MANTFSLEVRMKYSFTPNTTCILTPVPAFHDPAYGTPNATKVINGHSHVIDCRVVVANH